MTRAMGSQTRAAPVVRGPWPDSVSESRFVVAVAWVEKDALSDAVAQCPRYQSVGAAEAALAGGWIACWLKRRGQRSLIGVPFPRDRAVRPLAGVASSIRGPLLTVSCSMLEPQVVLRRYRWANLVVRHPALAARRHRKWATGLAWCDAMAVDRERLVA